MQTTLSILLLGVLLTSSLIFVGCSGDVNGNTSGAFVLGTCQLDDANCRLQQPKG